MFSCIVVSLTLFYIILSSFLTRLSGSFYRVSIKSFPDYKHLLHENYLEYKHIFLPIFQLVSKILCHLLIVTCVTFGFRMQHFETGGMGEVVRHPGLHDRRTSPPFTSFYGGMLRTKCFRHQFQILQI